MILCKTVSVFLVIVFALHGQPTEDVGLSAPEELLCTVVCLGNLPSLPPYLPYAAQRGAERQAVIVSGARPAGFKLKKLSLH